MGPGGRSSGFGRWGLGLPWPTPGDRRGPAVVDVVRVAEGAERAGFTSLWVDDAPDAAADRADAYSVLGALAATTTAAHLGILPARGSTRYPGIVAKIVSTVDVLSGGRAVACLPAHPGPDGSSPADLEDALRICRAVLDDQAPTIRGSVYSVDGAVNRPAPVARAGVPVAVSVQAVGGDRTSEGVDDAVLGLIGSLADVALVADGAARNRDGSPEVPAAGRGRRFGATATRLHAAADRSDRSAAALRVFGVLDVRESWLDARDAIAAEEVDRMCATARSLAAPTPDGGLDGIVLDLSAVTGPAANLVGAVIELGEGLAS